MAGRGGCPSPAPPPLQGGEPALCTAPSPCLASFLDRCPRPEGDALPQPAPQHRGHAPHCFLPGPDTRNVKQAFRACPHHPYPSFSSSPAPQPPPGPAYHSPGATAAGDREEERTRGNYFRICNARAHAHTQTHLPLGLASWLGQPQPGVCLKAPSASEARTGSLDTLTPLGVPCSSHAPRFPGPFSPP